MKSSYRTRCVLALAAIGILAGAPALAAQDPEKAAAKAAAKALKREAFLAGKAASKRAPVVQPKTESESLATRRVLAEGIVEMQLPEDRMVELVEIRRPDGTVFVGHRGDEAPAHTAERARQ